MIDVFETEILNMVKKSQLKSQKLRKELDHDLLIRYLKVICNSSARFYIRVSDLDKYIESNDTENIELTIKTLHFEGCRILNLVTNNKLNTDIVNDIINKLLNKYYLNSSSIGV